LSDKDKVYFIDALFDRQFLGVKPTNLKGMAKFAYISQTNSIDSQVKGYEDKTKTKLLYTPTVGGAQGGKDTPTLQVQEKEKVQYVYPTLDIFLTFCVENIATDRSEYLAKKQSAILKYKSWEVDDWHKTISGKRTKIKNWKTTILNTWKYL
jgi:hypothetical protein